MSEAFDEIRVASGVLPDSQTPAVHWGYREHEGTLSLAEARSRAELLLQALHTATATALIAERCWEAEPKAKGFGSAEIIPRSARGILALMSSTFDSLDGIEVAVGINRANRKLIPVLEISWYGETIEIRCPEAYHHAIALLQASESAETDAFLHFFFKERLNLGPAEASEFLKEFLQFRRSQELERLLQMSPDS